MRRLQPESHSRMKRGSSEMLPRAAKIQKIRYSINKYRIFLFSARFCSYMLLIATHKHMFSCF